MKNDVNGKYRIVLRFNQRWNIVDRESTDTSEQHFSSIQYRDSPRLRIVEICVIRSGMHVPLPNWPLCSGLGTREITQGQLKALLWCCKM
jgi:hypothetical protein